METVQLGVLKSGQKVFADKNGHIFDHEAGDTFFALVTEGLSKINLNGDKFAAVEVNFNRVIGVSIGVETTDEDEIVYALRPKRRGYTRFVKNREPEPCQTMVLVLVGKGSTYTLITGFIGKKSCREPWDKRATPQDKIFWKNHALIWGYEETVPGTETTECPW